MSVKSQDDKEDEVGPLKRELGATRKALEKAKQDSQSLFAESEVHVVIDLAPYVGKYQYTYIHTYVYICV